MLWREVGWGVDVTSHACAGRVRIDPMQTKELNMSKSGSFTVEAKQVPGSDEVFIEFPPEFMASQGWSPGDTLSWQVRELAGELESVTVVNLSKVEREKAAKGSEGVEG